ncbi:hypothetical protein Taro_014606 [Colocasia esculenta]|uniref:Uncharacterized protein n=1 Tax=Colocasia esculenta TaxID=4460 RepID=A0A843UJL5_COLES|nr:hypothetical protein [Colocasia esculenta]
MDSNRKRFWTIVRRIGAKALRKLSPEGMDALKSHRVDAGDNRVLPRIALCRFWRRFFPRVLGVCFGLQLCCPYGLKCVVGWAAFWHCSVCVLLMPQLCLEVLVTIWCVALSACVVGVVPYVCNCVASCLVLVLVVAPCAHARVIYFVPFGALVHRVVPWVAPGAEVGTACHAVCLIVSFVRRFPSSLDVRGIELSASETLCAGLCLVSIPLPQWGGCFALSRFCHGSVDTPIDGVDTGSESLKLFHEDRVKCVDIAPSSVDTRPSLQKTQLPDWDSVSTQPVAVSTLVSTPRRPVLCKWDSVSTHSLVVSTHSG